MMDNKLEQLPLFFTDPPEEPVIPYLGSAVQRSPSGVRAGTVLHPQWTHKIKGKARRGEITHGLYDESYRLYQTGGEMSNFIFWKKRLVSIAADAWRQVIDKVDWIEIIDHERNECWRISATRARKNAVRYEAGIGERIGVPIEQWDVIRASGTFKRKGKP